MYMVASKINRGTTTPSPILHSHRIACERLPDWAPFLLFLTMNSGRLETPAPTVVAQREPTNTRTTFAAWHRHTTNERRLPDAWNSPQCTGSRAAFTAPRALCLSFSSRCHQAGLTDQAVPTYYYYYPWCALPRGALRLHGTHILTSVH